MLFNEVPSMGEHHFLFIRCLMHIGMLLLITNVKFKHVMWDTVGKNDIKPLLGRVISGFISLTSTIIAIKSLPLVLVSIFNNLVPLVTAILSFVILGERLSGFEKICAVLSFAGVAIMLTGEG